MGLSQANRVTLLNIARGVLLRDLSSDHAPPAVTIQSELNSPAGCFVSLHDRRTHRLRGCVGRLDPHRPLWETVQAVAHDVLHDPRFKTLPVTVNDIPELEIEISVLSPPTEAMSPLDFDPQTDGIYLTALDPSGETRAGFFLPQVARETGWSREQLLERLCTEKLDLPEDAWKRPDARLYTFQVEVVGPERVSCE